MVDMKVVSMVVMLADWKDYHLAWTMVEHLDTSRAVKMVEYWVDQMAVDLDCCSVAKTDIEKAVYLVDW